MFDTYHSLGTTFPENAFKQWGFVLNAGISAYKSTFFTKQFLKNLIKNCGNFCDDQGAINSLYLNEVNVTWMRPPGVENYFGFGYQTLPNFGNSMQIMTFNENQVQRGKTLFGHNCENRMNDKTPWIISPNTPKNINGKIFGLKHYRSCFSPGSRELVDFIYEHVYKKHENVSIESGYL